MPDSCCAIGCTHRRGDKPGLCFYRIPSEKENPERRRLWICALRRASVPGEDKQWQPSKYTRLCSEHFIKGKVKLVSQHSILIIVLSVIIYLRIRSDVVRLSGPMHPNSSGLANNFLSEKITTVRCRKGRGFYQFACSVNFPKIQMMLFVYVILFHE